MRSRDPNDTILADLDAVLGEAMLAVDDVSDRDEDGDDFGDLTTAELAAEMVAILLAPSGSDRTVMGPTQAPTPRAGFVAAEASTLFDAHWRGRLDRAPATAPAASVKAPATPPRPRAALLARIGVLHTRYPELAAAHRHLTDVSDELLAALIADIEHVTGDRADVRDGE